MIFEMIEILSRIWIRLPFCWWYEHYCNKKNYRIFYIWLFNREYDIWKVNFR